MDTPAENLTPEEVVEQVGWTVLKSGASSVIVYIETDETSAIFAKDLEDDH